ncbi:MAG: isochorismatase family protein [Candidatus Freyrarchaeum guaymaensis]
MREVIVVKKEFDLNRLKQNTAVLVIDMQNDFASREKNTPERWEQIKKIIPNTKKILRQARSNGIPLILHQGDTQALGSGLRN